VRCATVRPNAGRAASSGRTIVAIDRRRMDNYLSQPVLRGQNVNCILVELGCFFCDRSLSALSNGTPQMLMRVLRD
jgi:hypothetical protein